MTTGKIFKAAKWLLFGITTIMFFLWAQHQEPYFVRFFDNAPSFWEIMFK